MPALILIAVLPRFPIKSTHTQFYFRTLVNNENQADRYADYRYGDVTADGQLVMPPLGFVGYIRFKADLPDGANLNPILVHVVPPAIKTQNGANPILSIRHRHP